MPSTAAPVRLTDRIDDARAEARRLEAAIEANGEKISMLAEDYNLVVIELDDLEHRLAAAERRIDRIKAKQAGLQRLVNTRAAALYMGAGASAPTDLGDLRAAGARTQYSAVAAERDGDLIDRFSVARQDLRRLTDELETDQAELEDRRNELSDQQRRIEAANADQEQLLGQVQGEIARLIEQERRAREEAARREAAARAAAAAAARAAAQAQPTPSDPPPSDSVDDPGDDGGSTEPPGTDPPDDPPPPPPPASTAGQTAVNAAMAHIGKPYIYAAPSSWSDPNPRGFDCSGLTGWAWARAGVMLPHHSGTLYATLPHVSQDALQPGDLVFYGSPIHHVGMYIGSGMMVEAPHTGAFVRTRSIYRDDYAGAARPG